MGKEWDAQFQALSKCFDPAFDNVVKSLRQGPYLRFCAAYDDHIQSDRESREV